MSKGYAQGAGCGLKISACPRWIRSLQECPTPRVLSGNRSEVGIRNHTKPPLGIKALGNFLLGAFTEMNDSHDAIDILIMFNIQENWKSVRTNRKTENWKVNERRCENWKFK